MYKSHSCGELRRTHTGQAVTLAGWVHRRRDHGGVVFIDLRDRSGLAQVVFNPDVSKAVLDKLAEVRLEWVLQVRGSVGERPVLPLRVQDERAVRFSGPGSGQAHRLEVRALVAGGFEAQSLELRRHVESGQPMTAFPRPASFQEVVGEKAHVRSDQLRLDLAESPLDGRGSRCRRSPPGVSAHGRDDRERGRGARGYPHQRGAMFSTYL